MKRNILVIVLITIIIGVLTFNSIYPIFDSYPKNNNHEEVFYDKNNKINYGNALNILYNVTKEKHRSGNNNQVFDFITNYLDELGVKYTVQEKELTKELYIERITNSLLEIKDTILEYSNITEEELFKDGNKSYMEYLFNNILIHLSDAKTLDEYYENNYKEKIDGNGDIALKNILVEFNDNNNEKENILFNAHYDSSDESYGAADNGMAIATLLENIRLHHNDKFNNNVYILISDGEELGLYGSYVFLKDNILDNIKLAINFDNISPKGHLSLHRVSNNKYDLYKKYLNATSKSYTYSFSSNLIELLDLMYDTDYSNFEKNNIDSLDFTLYADSTKYHTENDNFSNVSIKSLDEMTLTISKLITYFGNDTDSYNNDLGFAFEMFGISIVLKHSIYMIIMIIMLIVSILLYTKYTLKNKKEITNYIFGLLSILLSVGLLVIIKDLAFVTILPFLICSIGINLNNKFKKNLLLINYIIIILFIFKLLITLLLVIQNTLSIVASIIMISIPTTYLLTIYKNIIKE